MGGLNKNFNKEGIVLFGTSITLSNSAHPTNCGYWNWANAQLKQRLDVISNAGVGGNSTTQMLARMPADVLTKNANWVLVEGGINDVAADVAADTIYNNLVAIYAKLKSSGRRVIATTMLPSMSFDASETRSAIWVDVNDRIRAYAALQSTDYFILSDIAQLYLDTESAYAVPLAGYTVDGVHPNALGASTIGNKLFTDLDAYIPERDILIHTNDDTRLIWIYGLPNPLMTGTTGSFAAPASGVLGSRFIASGGGTWSQIAHGSGVGLYSQAVLGVESDTLTLGQVGDTTSDLFTIGDTIAAMLELQSDDDWVGAFNINLYLACLNASSAVLSYKFALGYSSAGGSGTAILNPRDVVLRTENIVIPATTDKLRTYWQFEATSGTVRVARYCIFKVR